MPKATATKQHKIATRDEWIAARKALLAKEKKFTRSRDRLSAARRELPWVRVDKNYVFEGPGGAAALSATSGAPSTQGAPGGKIKLADLFAGRSQLIVYHFMLGPGWEEGCPSCSLISDHFDGATAHLAARDVTLAVVSRAPFAEIAAFKKRMGWRFPWVSSFGGDFNRDYRVSFTEEEMAKGKVNYNYKSGGFPSEEAPGASVFYRDKKGAIFHTYSCYARGLDILIGAYNLLDLAPKGRDEDGLDYTMEWVRHHDRYGT